jgi:orotidine-5'-phosphate decarboxylase
MASTAGLERLVVALDTGDWDTFGAWCRRFGPRVGGLKVGLEAYVRFGPAAVAEARGSGAEVFLDLKLHDIPNTVAGAVAAAAGHGVRWLTVHAGGGRSMLEAAVDAAGRETTLLAVTVLTHLEDGELRELGWDGSIATRVRTWAHLAQATGCGGVVCSPHELPTLRTKFPSPFQLVTPGIRPAGSDLDDQRRVASPAAALTAGADLLVVGRPITRAADPDAVLEALATELSAAHG